MNTNSETWKFNHLTWITKLIKVKKMQIRLSHIYNYFYGRMIGIRKNKWRRSQTYSRFIWSRKYKIKKSTVTILYVILLAEIEQGYRMSKERWSSRKLSEPFEPRRPLTQVIWETFKSSHYKVEAGLR